jgi:predicted DNA-binding protein with PD1-like motif
VFVVSVAKGEEVVSTIAKVVSARGVTDAAIVSLIGAVQGSTISVMPRDDASKDILTEYPEPFEISGTGEVHNGKVHVHVVAGGEGGTVSGHLHEAFVDTWFVRAYIEPLSPEDRQSL